jgi:hypothetical protein
MTPETLWNITQVTNWLMARNDMLNAGSDDNPGDPERHTLLGIAGNRPALRRRC